MTISIFFDGICICYKSKEHTLQWKDIIKFSYQRSCFTIKYKEYEVSILESCGFAAKLLGISFIILPIAC